MTDLHPLLGTAPDAHLAAQFGVCRQTIANARKAAGIPVYRKGGPDPLRWFRCSDAGYAPVRAYAEAHGCSEGEAIRRLIAR